MIPISVHVRAAWKQANFMRKFLTKYCNDVNKLAKEGNGGVINVLHVMS